MKNLDERIARLSVARQALLEQIANRKALKPSLQSTPAAPSAMSDALQRVAAVQTAADADQSRSADKGVITQTYNAYHDQLSSEVFNDHSFFMNLGYVATDAAQHSPIVLPERLMSRNYVKLALEVIGDCDLTGLRVLDVGCGRGGAIRVMQTYFNPREITGIDLTSGAIAFCEAHHASPGTRFVLGDAETLPFDDASFDAVANIESSHHYGRIEQFYRGVWRVLAPGGHFLYATLLETGRMARDVELLGAIGFDIEREQCITPNVLAACSHDQGRLFGDKISAETDAWIADSIGLPGSQTYLNMESGRTAYMLYKLRKPVSASA